MVTMLPIPTTAMLAMTPSAFVDVTAPGSEMCVQRASSGGGGGHETRFGLDHPATDPTGELASRGVRRSRLSFPAPTGLFVRSAASRADRATHLAELGRSVVVLPRDRLRPSVPRRAAWWTRQPAHMISILRTIGR